MRKVEKRCEEQPLYLALYINIGTLQQKEFKCTHVHQTYNMVIHLNDGCKTKQKKMNIMFIVVVVFLYIYKIVRAQ